QQLDFAAKWKVKVVHFSEIRFLGTLDPDNLKRVRARADELNIDLEIGMRSICPSSKMFDKAQGNPVWTIEDPHLTLDSLAPYVLTSHVRDSAVWNTAQGVAVRSTRMGEGNIGMEDYLHKWKFTIRYFATKTTQRNSHAIDN